MKYIVRINRNITREFQVDASNETEAEELANDEFDELEICGSELYRLESEIIPVSNPNLHIKKRD